MALIEWLGFCVSVFGMYGVVIYLRFLLPCYVIPNVSLSLNNAEQSLAHAITTGAIPEMSTYRVDLEIHASRFARMRIESHRSPGLFPQIWLAVRHGLTCRLYLLVSQIEYVRLNLEVVIDEQRILIPTPQIVVGATSPIPAGDAAIPVTHINEPALPPTVPMNRIVRSSPLPVPTGDAAIPMGHTHEPASPPTDPVD